VNPHLLTSARNALRSAVGRARIEAPAVVDSVVEPLARLATLACTLTSEKSALWSPDADRIPFTTKSATGLAETVRQRLGVDDANPLYRLASLLPMRMNTLVFSVNHPRVESACALIAGTPLILIANDIGFQQLTACARQLGHLLAIASRLKGSDDEAHVALRAEGDSRPRPGPSEYFAANFAIELLVPTPGLAVALRRVRELLKVKNRALGDVEMLYLARIFGVTFFDIARKCERSQLLPLGGAAAIVKFIDEGFGGAEKRADDLNLPERPAIEFPMAPMSFLARLKRRITNGELSHAEAAEALGTSEQALASALPPGTGWSQGFRQ
jgi:hypothetical protein